MFINTGSNTTWVRRYRALLQSDEWTCSPRPADWARHFHPAVWGVPHETNIERLERRAYRLEYGDGGRALVYQYPQNKPLQVETILECEDYDNVSRWRSSITFHYQYALALAVNQELEADGDDGVIALGARRYQDCGNSLRAQSFYEAIAQHVPEPEIPVMYFGLRPIPFQTPADLEELYASFVTVLRALHALPAGEEYDLWDVRLVGMQIRTPREDGTWDVTDIPLIAEAELEDEASQGDDQLHVASSSQTAPQHTGDEDGIRVTLDTGCSVTYLPMCTIKAIAEYFNGEQVVLAPDSEAPADTYEIPAGAIKKDHDDREVTLRFTASRGQTVEIHVPALYFLYAPDPDCDDVFDALIYGQDEEDAEESYTFGVNFFHVAWVAMYKPVRGAPYVRMARQGSSLEEVERYQLPTWEET
ncbi:hypothetical protein PYCCODRAFT_1463216 [Trametes coccinea BRFM310]|uniref:Uncharacterized protein n=1 Tax=Trametes coccinea (strain BRFM310) TaxID=1353009 RepID=A0A1Y2J3F3_TRAC3|nr:hypothetical protein PYCCODRAFT_1463216 [Trametes coccinea BRFM310]